MCVCLCVRMRVCVGANRRDDPPRLGRALLGHAGMFYTFTVGLVLGRQCIQRVARLGRFLETKRGIVPNHWTAAPALVPRARLARTVPSGEGIEVLVLCLDEVLEVASHILDQAMRGGRAMCATTRDLCRLHGVHAAPQAHRVRSLPARSLVSACRSPAVGLVVLWPRARGHHSFFSCLPTSLKVLDFPRSLRATLR